jgi:3-phosphoshikimate 1-carboxyvinyltransferase
MLKKKFNLNLNNKILPFSKKITVDPDKSISIRSFLLGSISNNISTINNVLESEDVFSTIKCLGVLGIKIKREGKRKYFIYGKGLGSLNIKKNIKLNFGNSGTLARLLIGILTTTPKAKVHMSGDKSLNKRNMKKLINLMKQFGAKFYPKNKFYFPLKLISSEYPVGIKYKSGVSAQLKSAVILAGLNSFGTTKIVEKEESRNHTENMLRKNKQVITITKKKIKLIKINGKKNLDAIKVDVPGDPSSAAFFSTLTVLNQKSSILIKNVGLNSTRIGFYKLMKKHGANIKFKNLKKYNNEIRGDIFVKSSKLNPILASKKYYVNSTDEYPILFVTAALTKGVSIFKGITDLTNKESNRILEMQKILKQLNIKSKVSKDEFKIYGQGMVDAGKKKVFVPNLGDHRICMSAFILALLTGAKTKIKNFETVFTSSPSFLQIMKILGAKFEIQK